MLRRLPTALAVSSEDIAAYEETLAHRLALMHYRKTGEDPEGRFTGNNNQQYANSKENKGVAAVDPNDELRPLPGDKARIVRSREERVLGRR